MLFYERKKKIDFDKVNNLESSVVWYGDNDPLCSQEILFSLATALKLPSFFLPLAISIPSGLPNSQALEEIIK